MLKENKDNMWNSFIRLGEMIGDGEHNEPDGKWISKEYTRLSKILIPEIKEDYAKARKLKNQAIDRSMINLLNTSICKKCIPGYPLKQARSGSSIMYCTNPECKARYKAMSSNSSNSDK